MFELEAATPTRLAARFGMRLTTCVDQLRTLEARGHAARIPHPTDGRSYKVALTAAGREAHRAANGRFEEADRAFRSFLSDGQAEAQACLRAIRQAADMARGRMTAPAAPRDVAGVTPRRPVDRGG